MWTRLHFGCPEYSFFEGTAAVSLVDGHDAFSKLVVAVIPFSGLYCPVFLARRPGSQIAPLTFARDTKSVRSAAPLDVTFCLPYFSIPILFRLSFTIQDRHS